LSFLIKKLKLDLQKIQLCNYQVMAAYDYPGHYDENIGALRNPYRFILFEGAWVVQMGFANNTEHFIFDISDLPIVLNLEQSLLSESTKILIDGTQVPVYQLDDKMVPTWSSNNGVIHTKFFNHTIRLAAKLAGIEGDSRPKRPGTDKFDFRKQSLFFNSEILQWPHPVNPTAIAETGDPTQAVVVQEFPGPLDPNVNRYALMDLNGQKFYRMIAQRGQAFYFDLDDLPDVLAMSTWYRASVSNRSNEGYIACSFNRTCLTLHSYLMRERPDGMSIDHRNWNKWDNRRCNMAFVTQSEQNRNRENSHYNTPMRSEIVEALRSIGDTDFDNAAQRIAYDKYRHLWQESQANPIFPRHMFESSEKMKTGTRHCISIQQHPAMLLPSWQGPKEGGSKETTRWSGSKSIKIDWKQKMLVALEVYHSLETVGQIPEHLWTGRVRNGNAATPADIPRAKYFTWSQKSKSWTVGKCHPFIKATTNKIFFVPQGHAQHWKEKLFTLLAGFEKQHRVYRKPFVFPRFQPVDLQTQYNGWKEANRQTAPRDRSPSRT
jgi:hypothetical protein